MTGVTGCRACERGWWHCHGTAVQHAGDNWDCTGDPACAIAPEEHPLTVACGELAAGCDCQRIEA